MNLTTDNRYTYQCQHCKKYCSQDFKFQPDENGKIRELCMNCIISSAPEQGKIEDLTYYKRYHEYIGEFVDIDHLCNTKEVRKRSQELIDLYYKEREHDELD